VAEREGYERGDDRLGAADAALHVAHGRHLVRGERRESARGAGRGQEQAVARNGAHVGDHVGETDALEGPVEDVQREGRDHDARRDAEDGLQAVATWIGHDTDSRRGGDLRRRQRRR
jgi:hypothetical protein